MSKAETIFGLGILAFGAGYLKETLKLSYFVEEVPGPGFLPFWLSVGIIAMGIALTFRGVRSIGTARDVEWPQAGGRMRIAVTLVALFLSVLLLDTLGFLVTVALFVGVATFGLGGRSWKELLPVPVLIAVVLYGIFAFWLKVPLPTGILSFWG